MLHIDPGIDIELYDGGYLISQLKKYDIYKTAFDDDMRIKLDTILSYIGEEKRRIHEEIIVMLNEMDAEQYNDSIFVKKLEFIKQNVKYENRTVIEILQELKTDEGLQKDFFSVYSNFVKNEFTNFETIDKEKKDLENSIRNLDLDLFLKYCKYKKMILNGGKK